MKKVVHGREESGRCREDAEGRGNWR
jgi:hypothetical protein